MKTVADLLDAAKVAQELPSDSALARAVGIQGQLPDERKPP